MKHKQIRKVPFICTFLLAFFVGGCSSTSYEVTLKQATFEYESETVDVCQWITSVQGETIKDHKRSKNKINQGDYHIVCPEKNVRKLGKQEALIEINGIEQAIHFEVVDTLAPTISTNEHYEVEEGNPYFDIYKLVSVRDAYDPNVVLGFTGEVDINKEGSYEIIVNAKDSSKNKSSKAISVVIKGKEVLVAPPEVAVDNPSVPPVQNNSGGTTEGPTNNTPPSPPSTTTGGETVVPSKAPAQWLNRDGYTNGSAFETCQIYRGSASGKCSPMKDANGIVYGYQYIPY